MKYFGHILISAIIYLINIDCFAQPLDKTENSLTNSQPDSNRVNQLIDLSEQYYFNKPESCLYLANQAVDLARKINFLNGEKTALNRAGEALRFLGDFPSALEMQFKALELNRQMKDKSGEATSLSFIGFIYIELSEYRQSLNYFFQSKEIYDHIISPVMISFNLSNIGNAYEGLNLLDSALYFQNKAQNKLTELKPGIADNLKILIATRLGIIYARMNNRKQALQYFESALQYAYLINDKVNPSKIQYQIAESFLSLNNIDSGFYYARLAFVSGKLVSQKMQILDASKLLVKLFRDKNEPDSVIYYQDIAIALNDSLFGPSKLKQLQLLALKEQEKQQEILRQQEQYKTKIKMVSLIAMLAVFLIIAIILYRNNRHKLKVNLLLQKQKDEIQHTLTVLKSTQAQLIQSEKMASLGELTAGIAHEIQNPLNFVNNFSEVNEELLSEMKEELDKGNFDNAKAIANDAIENQQKILHHGKRADAIVKGMLQHSRSSSGVKESTDINALCDEYLRLSYHGLRAKDKSFNATMKTDFDTSIGNINIIPQDIGRVILNLINNAFFAVDEKKKRSGNDFEPTVTITTTSIQPPSGGRSVQIKVSDNGGGIPKKIMDKIFQPFFTTKPTGQGTGLGLSLSYDIVKAHGGELKVETKEGEGSTFIIQLPA